MMMMSTSEMIRRTFLALVWLMMINVVGIFEQHFAEDKMLVVHSSIGGMLYPVDRACKRRSCKDERESDAQHRAELLRRGHSDGTMNPAYPAIGFVARHG